ncbi:hypothetical protein V6N00_12670 [Tersicoccus sp. MR15.9]|uniref:hypothetical protein n=1 Tax=Tersicoccus mangrovi TaxID=3121635 RepID=UPI002FE674D8
MTANEPQHEAPTFTATQPRELVRALKAALVAAGAPHAERDQRFVRATVTGGSISVTGSDGALLVRALGGAAEAWADIVDFVLPVSEVRQLVAFLGRGGTARCWVDGPLLTVAFGFGVRDFGLAIPAQTHDLVMDAQLEELVESDGAPIVNLTVRYAVARIALQLRRISRLTATPGNLHIANVQTRSTIRSAFTCAREDEDPWLIGMYAAPAAEQTVLI